MAQAKKRPLTGAAKASRGFAAGKGWTVRHTAEGAKHTVVYKHDGKKTKTFRGNAAHADSAFVGFVAEAKG